MRQLNSARWLTVGIAAAALLTACNDPLEVRNKNNPDVARSYATPALVETIVSKLVQQIHQGMYASTTNLLPSAMTMSYESASQLGNFGMGARSAIPRSPIDNSRGNNYQAENFRTYDVLSRNSRSAANALTSLLAFRKAGISLGSPAQDARARSYGYFSLALATGEVALLYDSLGVPLPGVTADSVPKLRAAADAMKLAITMLDSALVEASSADATSGANGWPLPQSWIPTNDAGITLDQWKRIIRSFRARFRAGIGRTPAEHAAADWDAILADATNGLTQNFEVTFDGVNGWSDAWYGQARTSSGWHEMPLMIIGMADTSGAYDLWLQTGINDRQPFLIQTPDKRFPVGATRAAQQAALSGKGGTPAGTRLFYRNRPAGEDTPGWAFATSWYDQVRYWGIPANTGKGQKTIMTNAETDMLAAEAYIMKGNVAAAAALIDKWRTLNGLPAVGVTSLTQQVAGGRACVPRIPVGPNYNTTQCGNLLEAMKWEKRQETAQNGYAQWFVDGRGWGDLTLGTPLDWPTPYQEMDARALPFYNSQKAAATRGTYGFGP